MHDLTVIDKEKVQFKCIEFDTVGISVENKHHACMLGYMQQHALADIMGIKIMYRFQYNVLKTKEWIINLL